MRSIITISSGDVGREAPYPPCCRRKPTCEVAPHASTGTKWKRTVVMQVAEILSEQEGFTGLALDYAEQAEKALETTDKPAMQKRVLTLLGVADSQIDTVSFGEEKPRNPASTEAAYAENRRCDLMYAGE